MEQPPANSSDESLRPLTTMSSATSSRGPSRSPSKRSSARKFSLAAKLRSSSETSRSRDNKPGKPRNSIDEELVSLMGKIRNTQAVQESMTFRERAQKQLEGIDKKHLPQVLEEYTRIPHTISPNEMLSIKLETRVKIIDGVSKAKAAMIARVNADYEREDLEELERSTRTARVRVANEDQSAAHDRQHLVRLTARVDNLLPTDVKHDSSFHSQPRFNDDEATQCDTGSFPRHSAESERKFDTNSLTEVDSTASLMSCRTNTPEETPKPSRNRTVVGSKHASKENPFASFINEKSDTDAESLSNDLMLCYFAHNQVQDRLRSRWRQRKKSGTAEQVAKEVWEQLPEREHEVSKEFEGQLGQRRALTMDQLVYVWVFRFWQRCKDEGW